MIVCNNITEVAYNVQTTVDAKNNLLIDYKVTNQFTALYDKGYHTGSEFKIAHDLGIDTLVAIGCQTVQAPAPVYNAENFIYNPSQSAIFIQ